MTPQTANNCLKKFGFFMAVAAIVAGMALGLSLDGASWVGVPAALPATALFNLLSLLTAIPIRFPGIPVSLCGNDRLGRWARRGADEATCRSPVALITRSASEFRRAAADRRSALPAPEFESGRGVEANCYVVVVDGGH